MPRKTIVITGAHLTPALALIDKLAKNNWRIVYLGKKKKEQQLLPKGVRLIYISSGKLQRFNKISSLTTGIKLPLGVFQSLHYLKKIKPSLVLSFGGYTSVPVCLSAKLLSIPIIIHEQTLGAGLANKLTTPLAKKIALSWPQSQPHFPQKKTVLTGNPIRRELLKPGKSAKYQILKTEYPIIYITGGSQGSRIINQTISSILEKLLAKYSIIHQFGLVQSTKHWQQQLDLQKNLPEKYKKRYLLQKWFSASELAAIFNKADLVISRAGANTVIELALFSQPALLIPLPFTQKNEQMANAQFLAEKGTAQILSQKDLSSESLFQAIESMMIQINDFKTRAEKLKPLIINKGTTNLYRLIIGVISGS